MGSVQVLGIPVDQALTDAWRDWFAPQVQPFRIDGLRADVAAAVPATSVEPTREWVDTFFMYTGTWSWLDEATFIALRPSHRVALMASRRRSVRPKKLMPVWPSELARAGEEVILLGCRRCPTEPASRGPCRGMATDRARAAERATTGGGL